MEHWTLSTSQHVIQICQKQSLFQMPQFNASWNVTWSFAATQPHSYRNVEMWLCLNVCWWFEVCFSIWPHFQLNFPGFWRQWRDATPTQSSWICERNENDGKIVANNSVMRMWTERSIFVWSSSTFRSKYSWLKTFVDIWFFPGGSFVLCVCVFEILRVIYHVQNARVICKWHLCVLSVLYDL